MNSPAPSLSGARVAVLGLGYVGCVTAACLARLGHVVIGVDRDELKVKAVLAGQAPFYEPGLSEIVEEVVRESRLFATTNLAEALSSVDIALICVGTPSAQSGSLEMEQLCRVVSEIRDLIPELTRPLTVAVRSTVPPGTCDALVAGPLAGKKDLFVVSNPEFLREGIAVKDFMDPSLVVIGGSTPEALKSIADLYRPLDVEPVLVSSRTAELIKCAANAFHALKIAFANEIGSFAACLDINGGLVMEALCRDTVLNLSSAYLKPGFAFGGSCLSKDLRALTHSAQRLDLKLPLLESVLPSNDCHLRRAVQAVLELPARSIGVFGLAFKENTDDVRGSPAVTLLEQLIENGRDVRVFDPRILPNCLYGSNQRFLLDAVPQIGKIFVSNLETMLDWADYVVIAQKPTSEFAARIASSARPILNLVDTVAVPQTWR